ncbi:MAG TPA: tRNA dihydrouridine(20/20a) synthase DusA [Caulobacterales bacterium]|nr:tRNA dihydrouridine(20/20a) synthase DusA [Caulobacterales bacterium]
MTHNEKTSHNQMHRFCIAPMMDWTDRHCRALHRALTRRALLYTEMVTAEAVIRGDRARLIGFSEIEHPVALQLGGAEPDRLAEAARIGADSGYDEINLNVGCPSDRVQSGKFGACLMREPALVAACVAAMGAAAKAPVTVKCRIGVDEQEPEKALFALADAVAGAGVKTLIVHARKAWLDGLSPKQNRDVPPLDYALVRRLKAERPKLEIILNGGLRDLDHARAESIGLDGVMLGRAAYQTPGILLAADPAFFGAPAPAQSERDAVLSYLPYIEARLAEGAPLNAMTRHMLGLFHGQRGARTWRRILSENVHKTGADVSLVREALDSVEAREIASAA